VDGLRGYHAKFSDTGADLKQVLALARSMHPGVPVFLLGESMGGTIVLRLLQTDPEVVSQLAGVALLGPVVRVASAVLPPPPVMFILRLLARFFPR